MYVIVRLSRVCFEPKWTVSIWAPVVSGRRRFEMMVLVGVFAQRPVRVRRSVCHAEFICRTDER